MMDHTIITIGRQFGSGGHEVGNRLAERLNIPLYDHNLIRMAARDLGISNEDAGRVDETRLGNVLSSYYIGMGDYTTFMLSPEVEKPVSDQLFDAQSAIIRKLAERGPGIFVGRGADYVLGDYSNVVNTFIYAYKVDRIIRFMDIYKLCEIEAVDKIKKIDRERRLYYEGRTDRKWGSIEANAILLNSSLLGIDGAVDALEAIYHKWENR